MNHFENIPTFLKENCRWCGWKYETRHGRKVKIPKNVLSRCNAKTSDPETFVSFDAAIKNCGSYDGLGILLENNLVGVDLDHCIENGEIQRWAQEVIRHFPNSYIEKSPSETGIRIFTLLPDGIKYSRDLYFFRQGELEIYVAGFTNRFMTATGDMIQCGEVLEEKEGLRWVLETYLRKKGKGKKKDLKKLTAIRHIKLSDEQLLSIAIGAKDQGKFQRLWKGDRSMHLHSENHEEMAGEPDYSASDMALVEKLLFYSNGDIEQTDRLFRMSGLFRPKWDERRGPDETYGSLTIKETLKKMDSFYNPSSVPADVEFNEDVQKLTEMDLLDSMKYPWTELGAARLFADFFKESLRYVPERKSWFFYEDGIWQQDLGSVHVRRGAQNLSKALFLFGLYKYEGDQQDEFLKFAGRWETHQFRAHVVKDAEPFYPISYREFDLNPKLLNCLNGTLDLETGDFSEHTNTDYLTMKAVVNYDPAAFSPRWTSFIREIMENNELNISFLQKAFGYALSGSTEYECFFILYGAKTRNGKGTLCESILNLLGSYATASAPEILETKWHSNSSAPNEDVARLAGKRLVNMAEPKKALRLNVALTKSLTGNDSISARFLNENSFVFKPQFKIFINTNYLPTISDPTIFQSSRIHVIPFNRHFSQEEQDIHLKQYFAKPEERSAILNWMLEGYYKLQEEGMNEPCSITAAVDSFYKESDRIGQFLEDETENRESSETRSRDLYMAYSSWCKENGFQAENSKNFKDRISKEFSVVRKRPNNGGEKTTLVLGLELKEDQPFFLVS